MLPATYPTTNSHPVASGATADVYEGDTDGHKVCVKRVRIYSDDHTWGVQKAGHQFLPFPPRFQTSPKVLSGDYHVEAREAPKHCPLPRCYQRSPTTRFRLDVRWKYNGIY